MKYLILMIFMSMTANANSDIELATSKLAKSSGRIIRVMHLPNGMNIDNICSATLVGPSTIVTASHCFYRNPDEVAKHQETFHFDIDGITSKNLADTISNLSDKDGIISGANLVQAKALLQKMPQIQNAKIHKNYILSAEAAYQNRTTPEAEFDVATATLSFQIKAETVKLAKYIDGEAVYIGGHPGKFLSGKQKVIECFTGLEAKEYLNSKVDEAKRTSGRRRGKPTPPNNRELKLASYEKYHQTAVLNVCDDTIVRGFSGGPQVVVRNNEAFIVAVTSQMFESEYGLAGNKVLGAKLSNLQSNSQIR